MKRSFVPDVVQFGNALLCCMAHSCVIAAQLPQALPFLCEPIRTGVHFWHANYGITILVVGILVLFPASLKRDLSMLKPYSLIGLFWIFYTLVFMFVAAILHIKKIALNHEITFFEAVHRQLTETQLNMRSFGAHYSDLSSVQLRTQLKDLPNADLDKILDEQSPDYFEAFQQRHAIDVWGLVYVIAIFSTAFSCHFNSPKYYFELEDASDSARISSEAQAPNEGVGLVLDHQRCVFGISLWFRLRRKEHRISRTQKTPDEVACSACEAG